MSRVAGRVEAQEGGVASWLGTHLDELNRAGGSRSTESGHGTGCSTGEAQHTHPRFGR